MNNNLDTRYDPEYVEEFADEVCPDCGAMLLVSYNASSPDDYTKTWTCIKEGTTFSE